MTDSIHEHEHDVESSDEVRDDERGDNGSNVDDNFDDDATDDDAESSTENSDDAAHGAPKKVRKPKPEPRQDRNVTDPLHDFVASGDDDLDAEAMAVREDRARYAREYAERLAAHNANGDERAAITKRMRRDRDRLAALGEESKKLGRRLASAKTMFEASRDAVERLDRENYTRTPKAES